MSAVQQILVGQGQTAAATDPNYANVGLLMHCNTDLPFIDNSPVPKTMTTNLAAFVSSAQARFGNSMQIGSGGGWVTTPHATSLDFATGNFSVEISCFPLSLAGNFYLITKNLGTGVFPWCIYWRASFPRLEFLGFDSGGSLAYQLVSSIPLTINTWNVLCATRSGNTFEISVNGLSGGTAVFASSLYSNAADSLSIGGSQSGSETFNGYIDEIRLTKGVVRPNTVPLAPFPNS